MRRLIWIVAVLTALYGGYWVVGSRAALSGAEAALAQLKAEGAADYADVSIAGFPSRFDITVTDPAFRAEGTGWGWRAAFLQILALSYRPNHIILVLPDRQDLDTPSGPATLTGTGFRASAVFGASTDLPLDHAQAVGETPRIAGTGWAASAGALRAAIRRAPDGPANAYDLALDLPGIAPEDGLAETLAPLADAAGATGQVVLRARVTLDGPLDRTGTARRITGLDLTEATVFWGKVDASASGSLAIDADGVPEGRITLTARNWEPILTFAADRGLIDPRTAPTLAAMLTQLAAASGDPETLSIPLVLAGGRMSLGPLPLGPAPRF